MPDPIRPPAPSPASPAPASSADGGSMRDRLGELARRRAKRPTTIRAIYGLVGAFAVVYLVGVLAGWWGSPVADKVRARLEREAEEKRQAAPRAPAAPPRTDEGPAAPR